MYQDYTMPYYAESPPTLRSLFSEVLVTQFPSQYSRDTVPSDSVLYCTSRAKAFDCVRSTVRSLSIRSYRIVLLVTLIITTRMYILRCCVESPYSKTLLKWTNSRFVNERELNVTIAFSLMYRRNDDCAAHI